MRKMTEAQRLVRVVAPYFVAGFETDGVVRRAAPILAKHILGKTDDEARAIIVRKGWKASVVAGRRALEQSEGK